ncbi:MAG: class I SAM-dependent methyltransferase [Pirellulales bacterium]|nr:class I SAM-dependent methyltransferase [Pirellulales bacterium]
MSLRSEAKILYHVVFKRNRGRDHAGRMEDFYGGQAQGYDAFRSRMLKGREEMYGGIDAPPGATWVDLGGGTGANLEFLGPRLATLGKVVVVDISPSMLAVARQRIADRGWKNVQTLQADVTAGPPVAEPVDVVTFSYSLTMIPDWFTALETAWAMLKPGGWIGVVDFYVSRKHVSPGMKRHSWLARSFWPVWFATNNVFPSPDHVAYLHRRFEPVHFTESSATVPYLRFLRTPYFVFLGRRAA